MDKEQPFINKIEDIEEMDETLGKELITHFPILKEFQQTNPKKQRRDLGEWIRVLNHHKQQSKTKLEQHLDIATLIQLTQNTNALISGLKKYDNNALEVLGFLEWKAKQQDKQ